jgi:Holliday junction resolvasome RuvABC endonuclease subunit
MRSVEFRVMGVDPGFKKLGIGYLRYTALESGSAVTELDDVLNITTEKDRGKRSGKQKVDDARRIDEITLAFHESVEDFQPTLLAFEAQPFVRNARVSAQIAMAWGSCWTLARRIYKIPVFVYDPKEIKRVTTGNEEADKPEVEAAIRAQFPLFSGWPEGDDVFHVADAVGAGLAAIKSRQFELAVREWRRKGESGVDLRETVATATEPKPRLW